MTEEFCGRMPTSPRAMWHRTVDYLTTIGFGVGVFLAGLSILAGIADFFSEATGNFSRHCGTSPSTTCLFLYYLDYERFTLDVALIGILMSAMAFYLSKRRKRLIIVLAIAIAWTLGLLALFFL